MVPPQLLPLNTNLTSMFQPLLRHSNEAENPDYGLPEYAYNSFDDTSSLTDEDRSSSINSPFSYNDRYFADFGSLLSTSINVASVLPMQTGYEMLRPEGDELLNPEDVIKASSSSSSDMPLPALKLDVGLQAYDNAEPITPPSTPLISTKSKFLHSRSASSPGGSKRGRKRREGRYECPDCHKGFKRPWNLKSHRIIHTDTWDFFCEHCSRGFRRANDLKRHLRLHTGERPYQCNTCLKSFSRPDNASTHVCHGPPCREGM
ncbi:hypothetical protein SmJEL517_g02336 [Synchytrium microbalum]|uniref:C2H2-type domain-containing protein n=1 Tax=Synchytrium microbalum TaxID=1806994 RepID=A0A507CCL5_9FUNG|nr:uncharacterized protein SmJEL517_g02336 [Synchytrium microbalum]TPX35305.1 hypothetical protein SmJEL517_g02336 [Synchytrium microbalum]